MEQYRIGKFTFDTYEDYVRGKADVKNIYKITHSVDIYRPDVALRLYQSIRSGKFKIYSEIGEHFLLDLADIVAESAKENKLPATEEALHQSKESKSGQQAKSKQEMSSKQQVKFKQKMSSKQQVKTKQETLQKHQSAGADRSRMILGAVCMVAAIGCFVWYFWSDFTNSRGNKMNDYLRNLKETSQESQEMVETLSNDAFFRENAPELEAAAAGMVGDEGTKTAEEYSVLPEYEAILQENQNFAGWITIEGTKVDYPVMLTKSDADYYLMRNFEGQNDINGTLFMDARTNLEQRSTNIIIYGHNMKSGEMFGGLKKYLDEEYWMEHKQISFDTIYEKGTYEIFAVCLAQVQYRDAEGFRYYDFIQADSEEAFQEYLDNIKQLSVFIETDMPVYGDELLTLSTCNNYVEDGRLFLVAKKCMDAE